MSAYDRVAEIIMSSTHQYPTVDTDTLQALLREHRELFLAVEHQLGLVPQDLVASYKKDKNKPKRVQPSVFIADVREILGRLLPQAALDVLHKDPAGRRILGIADDG